MTAWLIAAGLQLVSAAVIYVYKTQRDKAVHALADERQLTETLKKDLLRSDARAKEAEEEARKAAAKAAQEVADASLRTNEVTANFKAEITKLEKDLASCTTPDALRARLNNLNSLLQGT